MGKVIKNIKVTIKQIQLFLKCNPPILDLKIEKEVIKISVARKLSKMILIINTKKIINAYLTKI